MSTNFSRFYKKYFSKIKKKILESEFFFFQVYKKWTCSHSREHQRERVALNSCASTTPSGQRGGRPASMGGSSRPRPPPQGRRGGRTCSPSTSANPPRMPADPALITPVIFFFINWIMDYFSYYCSILLRFYQFLKIYFWQLQWLLLNFTKILLTCYIFPCEFFCLYSIFSPKIQPYLCLIAFSLLKHDWCAFSSNFIIVSSVTFHPWKMQP